MQRRFKVPLRNALSTNHRVNERSATFQTGPEEDAEAEAEEAAGQPRPSSNPRHPHRVGGHARRGRRLHAIEQRHRRGQDGLHQAEVHGGEAARGGLGEQFEK